MERIAKALAKDMRLGSSRQFRRARTSTSGDPVCRRGATPARVSDYWKILLDAELIECRREGQFAPSPPVGVTVNAYAAAVAKTVGSKKRRAVK
jgi:hypothetical protein